MGRSALERRAARVLLCLAPLALAAACARDPGVTASADPAGGPRQTQERAGPEQCPPRAPSSLPDGTAAGDAVVIEREGVHPVVRWGAGSSRVVQRVGVDALDIIGLEQARIRRPGPDVFLMPVGDPGVGQTAIAFEVDGCTYTVWLTSQVTLRQARSFARRSPTARG